MSKSIESKAENFNFQERKLTTGYPRNPRKRLIGDGLIGGSKVSNVKSLKNTRFK